MLLATQGCYLPKARVLRSRLQHQGGAELISVAACRPPDSASRTVSAGIPAVFSACVNVLVLCWLEKLVHSAGAVFQLSWQATG